MLRAIFFDRDGTLIDEPVPDVIDSWEKFKIKTDVSHLVELAKLGYEFFIISNQEAIGSGMLSEAFYRETNQKLVYTLRQQGIFIKDIFTCPHAVDENCDCRKPKAGLVQQALQKYPISLTESWIVGDRASDVELAHTLGMHSIFIQSDMHQLGSHQPDAICKDLRETVGVIQGRA